MAALELMALAKDNGFRRRVEFALFDEAKGRAAPAPTGDDLAYVNGILNGETPLDHVVTAVVVTNADPENADDASLKSTVAILWPFLARAWAARTV